MKAISVFLAVAVFWATPVWAQTPAAADGATVTAVCKDGTPFSGKTLRGACRGHGGVDKKAGAGAGAAAEKATPAAAATTAAAVPAEGGVTLPCKDGTTWSGKSTRGACSGHGGVNKSGSASTTAATPAAAAPAAAPAQAPAAAAARPAPAGAAGEVWVNTETKVYHCAGDRFFGKTKQGEYLSEAQANAQGFRAARGKTCGAG